MTERHLGDAVAAVADGQLRGAARDRSLAHIATCARCRQQVEAHRALRHRLAALDVPALPVGVTAGLLALAPRGQRLPVAPGRAGLGHGVRAPAPLQRPAMQAFPSERSVTGRRRIVAAGVIAAAALGGGATLGLRSGGGTGSSGPVITPGDVELTRYTEMSRSVVMDDPAPALATVARH